LPRRRPLYSGFPEAHIEVGRRAALPEPVAGIMIGHAFGDAMVRYVPLISALCAFALLATVGGVLAQERGQPLQVVVAPVRVAPFVDRVEALGTTRANETVGVTASVTEKIAGIHFDDGQVVEKGDVLVVLAKDEEEAELEAAEAILKEKRLAYGRATALEQRKFTATAQLDERRAELSQAESQIAVIEARIADRVIRAPFSGAVGLRNISVGTLVEPGDVITTLDDLSTIKVDFSVPSAYLPTLNSGLGVVARADAFGDRRFEGVISGVDSRVDPVTRSIVARAVLPNADGALKPGLLMTIELLKNPRRAMFIPEEALIPRGRSNSVLVVDETAGNTVVRREVTIGMRQLGSVEILEGLSEGDKVVTRGALQVRPGQQVSIIAVDDSQARLPEVLRGTRDGTP
jgi:membrane fusion protein (multidrug efflux system)